MAKVSMVQREVKRAKTVAKFAAKRAELKAIIHSVEAVSYTHLTLPTIYSV